MPISESCEPGCGAVLFPVGVSLRQAAGPDRQLSADRLDEAARDFTSFLYSMMFRQMQKTIPRDDGPDPFAGGVRDLVAVYLPRALARDGHNPLAHYVRESFQDRFGELTDEQA